MTSIVYDIIEIFLYLFSRYSISLIGSSESNFQLLLHTTTAFSKSFMVPFPNMTISLIRSNILAKKKAPKTELAGTLTYSLLYSVLFKITFVFLYYWNILICKLIVYWRGVWFFEYGILPNILNVTQQYLKSTSSISKDISKNHRKYLHLICTSKFIWAVFQSGGYFSTRVTMRLYIIKWFRVALN